jgi:hypothetical protein
MKEESWFLAAARRLPPNGRADRIIVWLSIIGLVLLTVGICLGWF